MWLCRENVVLEYLLPSDIFWQNVFIFTLENTLKTAGT